MTNETQIDPEIIRAQLRQKLIELKEDEQILISDINHATAALKEHLNHVGNPDRQLEHLQVRCHTCSSKKTAIAGFEQLLAENRQTQAEINKQLTS